MNTVTEAVYTGAADIGKVYSTISLIGGIVFSILLFVIAIFLFQQKNVRTEKTLATVTTATCSQYERIVNNQKQIAHTCNLEINYTINNKLYTAGLNTDKKYSLGSNILIEYDPNNPTDISIPTVFTTRFFGIISSVVSVLILIYVVLNYVFSKKYKVYAATQGAFTTVDIAKGLTKKIFD